MPPLPTGQTTPPSVRDTMDEVFNFDIALGGSSNYASPLAWRDYIDEWSKDARFTRATPTLYHNKSAKTVDYMTSWGDDKQKAAMQQSLAPLRVILTRAVQHLYYESIKEHSEPGRPSFRVSQRLYLDSSPAGKAQEIVGSAVAASRVSDREAAIEKLGFISPPLAALAKKYIEVYKPRFTTSQISPSELEILGLDKLSESERWNLSRQRRMMLEQFCEIKATREAMFQFQRDFDNAMTAMGKIAPPLPKPAERAFGASRW